jgi:hypothetical protein
MEPSPERAKENLLSSSEELLHDAHVCRSHVIRQALDEYLPVLFLKDAIVEQYQKPPIVQRADQPSETLF